MLCDYCELYENVTTVKKIMLFALNFVGSRGKRWLLPTCTESLPSHKVQQPMETNQIVTEMVTWDLLYIYVHSFHNEQVCLAHIWDASLLFEHPEFGVSCFRLSQLLIFEDFLLNT